MEVFMRIIKYVFISIAALLFISCSSNFSMVKHHSKPHIAPNSDKAILVIYRGASFGYGITMDTYLDNTFIGQTKGSSYFIVSAEPGERFITGIAEKNVRKKLLLEAGKVYYINQGIYPGILLAESRITLSNSTHFSKKLKSLDFYYYNKNGQTQASTHQSASMYLSVAGVTFSFDIQG